MSEGTVGWWVVGLYLRSLGVFLSIAIILSLILMQLSQNFTFLWLTYWVKNKTKNSTSFHEVELTAHPTEKTSILDHGVNAIDNVIHTIINTTTQWLQGNSHGNETVPGPLNNKQYAVPEVTANVTPTNTDNFYLEIYFALAGLNLVFTIMRAFLFAYGGVKAATRIHKVLLKVIVKVCCLLFTYMSISINNTLPLIHDKMTISGKSEVLRRDTTGPYCEPILF